MATTNVDIRVSTTGTNSLTRLDKALQKSTANAKRLDGAMEALKGTLGAVGIAIGAGAIFDKLKKADKAGAAIRSLGVDSSKLKTELVSLRKELNNNVSQLELSQNAFNVIQAGFKDTAEVTKILEAATKSAQAKLVDSTTTVNALTSTLRAYGFGAGSATAVTEKFFQTIADGNLTLDQYAAGIGGIAPTAAAAGVSLNELNAALAAASRIQASNEAFTGLGSIIDAIVAPSKQAKDLAAELGIQFNEQALKAKGLTGVLKDMFDATGGNIEQLTTLIGRMEGVNTLLALGNDGFTAYSKNLENQGSAAGKVDKAYKEMSNTIVAAFGRITNAFDGLVTSNGELAGVIIPLLDSITALINGLDTPMGAFILKLGLVTAGFFALQGAIIAVKGTALALWVGQQIALLRVFGPQIYATAAATNTLALANKALAASFGFLKLAIVALPLAGLVAVINENIAAKKEFDRVMRDGSVDELKVKIEELIAKKKELEARLKSIEGGRYYKGQISDINQLKGQIDEYGRKIDIATRERTLIVNIVEKRHSIAGIDYQSTRTGRLVPVNAPETVSQQRERERLEALQNPVISGGGSSGGGGGSAPTGADGDSIIRRLDEQLQLLQAKDDLEKTILQNQFKYEASLRQSAEILDASKRLTAEQLANEVLLAENRKAYTEYANAGFKQMMEEAKAREDALRPLEEQRELLEAKLNGTEKEVRLRQQIDQIMRDTPGLERAQVEELVKGNAALEEQVQEAQKLEAVYKEIAGAIASEVTGAFKSIIDGTKSVDEAFADMAQGIANKMLDMAMKILQDALMQQLMNLLKSLAGAPGGGPVIPSFPTPTFDGGGYTGDGPRSGGLDGKGGFLSVLHPQETVTDHYGDAAAAMSSASSNSSAFSEANEAMTMATAIRTESVAAQQEAQQMAELKSSSTTTVQVETTLVDQIEVVTLDQLNRATAASAKAAEANVFRGLKNMPAVRGRAGVK